MKKIKYNIILKIAASVLIIIFLIIKLNPRIILKTISAFNPILLLPVSLLYLAAFFPVALSLKLMLNKQPVNIRLSHLYNFIFTSELLRIFTPANIGQLSLIPLLTKTGVSPGIGTAVFIIRKAINYISTILIAIAALFFIYPQKNIIIYFLIIFLILLLIFISVVSDKIRDYFKKYINNKFLYKMKGFSKFFKDILFNHKEIIFFLFFLEIIKKTLIVLVFYIIFKGFNLNIAFFKIFLVHHIVSAISFIPISLGGLGVAEAGGIFFYNLIGADKPVILSSFIIYRIVSYGITTLGFLLLGKQKLNN